MKGKFIPFYNQYKGTKTKRAGLVGYVFHQDYSISPHNVALLVHENPGRDTAATRDSLTQFDNPYGIVADEGIDVKAANYISSTLARFKSLNELTPVEILSPTLARRDI